MVKVNSTASDLDMIVFGGPFSFVEVKWSDGPLPLSTICCGPQSVVSEARNHPSGTYLLEAHMLDAEGRALLVENGGVELP